MKQIRRISKAMRHVWAEAMRSPLFSWTIPYEAGVKIQRTLLSPAWVQRLLFARPVAVMHAWGKICSISDLSNQVLLNLMINTWRGWRMTSLKRPSVAEKWLRVEGLENLRQAMGSGRGIILLTIHTLRTGTIQRAVRMVSDKDAHLFAGRVEEEDNNMVMATYVRRIIEARKQLEQGEVIVIGGDGLRGNTSITLPFHGRAFPFRSGFAELAARSNAVALAVFIYYELDGRVILEFSAPIEAGSGTREEQVTGMVRQYARILTERWPRLLPSVTWRKLKQILAMPPA